MISSAVRATSAVLAFAAAAAVASGDALAQAQPQAPAAGVPATQQAQAAPAADWGAIAGTVAFTTDYVYRGISQTQGKPALQAGLEYTKEFGMFTPYAGLYASNADFPDTVNNTDLKIDYELDLYFGLRIAPTEPLLIDVGYLKYYYPWEDAPANNNLSFSWSEVYGKISYDFGFAKPTLGWWHSENFSAGGGDSDYFAANIDVPLPWELTFTGHIGRLNLDNEVNFGFPDYTDWSLGVSRSFDFLWGSTVALTYSDTDVSRTESLRNKSDGATGTIDNRFYNLASPRVFLSVTKSF